jgi:HAD superfamily hydrolase (TIGR01509 family)
MKLPYKPVAVIFDMDGLIFDTETLYQRAYIEAAEAAGYDLPLHVAQQTIGSTWALSSTLLTSHLGEVFRADEFFADLGARFDRLALTDLRLKPGVIPLLDYLDEAGLPRCIATSSGHPAVQSHLTAHGLVDRFQHVVGHGDYAQSKPAPDPFLNAAARLGVDPRFCVALEDSHNGIRSASAAGMIAIMVPDLMAPTPEIVALSTAVAPDLFAVAALLREAHS